MARDAVRTLVALRTGVQIAARKRRHHPMVASLPLRWRFYRSGLYISPLAPFGIGMIVGILTFIMGAIFVLCVLAFRRGIMGEIIAWLAQRRAGNSAKH